MEEEEEGVNVKMEEEEEEEDEMYLTIDDFFSDIELIFTNCRLYNKGPDNAILIMCGRLEEEYSAKKIAYYDKLTEMKELDDSVHAIEGEDLKYLVKWYDLSYKDCTWEKASSLDSKMIEAYENRQVIPPYKLQPPKTKAERVILGEKAILQFKDNKVDFTILWFLIL